MTHLGFSRAFDRAQIGYTSPPTQKGRPYFLYVGTRAHYKNFSRVLEAFAAGARLSAEFDLVAFGGPPFTAPNWRESTISGSGQTRYVSYLEATRTLLASMRGRGRSYTLLSTKDSVSRRWRPWAAAAPSFAATRVQSLRLSERQASTSNPRDVDSIRSALEALSFNDLRRDQLITAGISQCRLFSWGKCAAESLEAYDKC